MNDLLDWHDGLAPGHERDSQGNLLLGRIPAAELAAAYATPLVAFDLDVFDASIAEFVAACAPYGVEISYAGKALLLVELARRLAATPLDLDVCSLGEIVTAERAHFPPERMTLHGCGKPDEELDAAVAGRVGTIVCDSLEEIERLAERAAAAGGRRVRAIVRVNTGIEAHTHEFVRTTGDNTKFGVPERNLDAAIAALARATHVRFVGLHSHIGSQIYESHAFVENARALVGIAKRFAAGGCAIERLIVGGGFGVQYAPDGDRTVAIGATVEALALAVRDAAAQAGLPAPRIGIEPGRALAARPGTSIYTVRARKRQSERTYLVVDGSLADNPRPALYRAYHHYYEATGRAGARARVTVSGRSCENDELGTATVPDDLQAGDLVAACTTGAYTYCMSSNYNRFVKPAVVALQGGKHRPWARRQTIDDVLREDCNA